MADFKFTISYTPGEEVVIPQDVKARVTYLVTTRQAYLRRKKYPGYWSLLINSVKEENGNWRLSFEPTCWNRLVADNRILPNDTVQFKHSRSVFNVSVWTHCFKKWLQPRQVTTYSIPLISPPYVRADRVVLGSPSPNTSIQITNFFSSTEFVDFGDKVLAGKRARQDVKVHLVAGELMFEVVMRKYKRAANAYQYKIVKGWKDFLIACNLGEGDAVCLHGASVDPPVFIVCLLFKAEN